MRGFTLIELMVVVAIIALLLCMLSFWYLSYVRRARLIKATNQVATAGKAWCAANPDSLNAAMGPGVIQPSPINLGDFSNTLTPSDILELEKHLGVVLPKVDPFGRSIEYLASDPVPPYPAGPLPNQLMIRSRNANGLFDPPYSWRTLFPSTNPVPDVVWVNCDWVQLPF